MTGFRSAEDLLAHGWIQHHVMIKFADEGIDMATSLLGLILALLLPISAAAGPLSLRLEQWPSWQLPAPLPRPSPGDDLIYPAWFEGDWQLSSSDGINAVVRFARRADGAVVGTRAANAMAIGKAVLGDELLEVQDDPGNPNRQLARLSDDRVLDTRISGRRSETARSQCLFGR